MLFHGLQTQTGVLRDLLVTSPFTGQLRNFPLAACEASQAWQTEKPESSGSFAVPANVFTSDEEMWPGRANGIDLLELNCGLQVR
jgi:hypothetical protein